ncbi:glutathione S-transferase family protein [Croceibacterium sp. LX-88]|jgi:glutathione S-transferase|uniref:Glutathione S-transferase family protein n=1 Tax=Croceibacterium selenioxidans TaxID=2838833 RepID=A0ABS5W2Z0_9SPHN|nr:glutathione S-transferase family protein [Croceibacterium selenioxidans]MBT2133702.1 glutathione S-transferase family protein [Croceibacterium selenioxidans]
MLKLYSFGPGANSLKPMLTLFEKGLEYEQHLLNPAKFEHHSDWYKALNPRGQVPALDDDGRIVTESTVICEYLEDAHPTAVKLRPDDPYDRAQMRVWTKWVDEYFCWCVSTIGWHRGVKFMAQQLSDAEFEEHLKKIPIPEQQVKWRRAREGFPQDLLDEEMRKIGVSVRKLDDHLAHNEWLAGGMFSLADICNFAIANGMELGFAEQVNKQDTPHLVRWIEQINARPKVQAMFAAIPRERLGPPKDG